MRNMVATGVARRVVVVGAAAAMFSVGMAAAPAEAASVRYTSGMSSAVQNAAKKAHGSGMKSSSCMGSQAKKLAKSYAASRRVTSTARAAATRATASKCSMASVRIYLSRQKKSKYVISRLPASGRSYLKARTTTRVAARSYVRGKTRYTVVILAAPKTKSTTSPQPTPGPDTPDLTPTERAAKTSAIKVALTQRLGQVAIANSTTLTTDACIAGYAQQWAQYRASSLALWGSGGHGPQGPPSDCRTFSGVVPICDSDETFDIGPQRGLAVEIIAREYDHLSASATADSFIAAWYASPAHRDIMTRSTNRYVGVGIAYSEAANGYVAVVKLMADGTAALNGCMPQ